DRPVVEELLARQYETPPSVRSLRAEVPLDLDALVSQMMARDPNDRYQTPLAVIAALDDFLEPSLLAAGHGEGPGYGEDVPESLLPQGHGAGLALHARRSHRVLIVSPRAET